MQQMGGVPPSKPIDPKHRTLGAFCGVLAWQVTEQVKPLKKGTILRCPPKKRDHFTEKISSNHQFSREGRKFSGGVLCICKFTHQVPTWKVNPHKIFRYPGTPGSQTPLKKM